MADTETHATTHPRLLLAGESLRGPGSAIEAVADGRRAARAALHLLRSGQPTPEEPESGRPLDPYPADVIERLRRNETLATQPAPFADEQPHLAKNDARREGDRCLGCAAGSVIDESECAWCLTCYRVCPVDAVEVGDSMYADPARCQACGLCAALCPAVAISLTAWEYALPSPGEAARDRGAVALVCRYLDEKPPTDGADVARVPCPARLKPVEVLNLFSRGYNHVSVHPCAEDRCKYGRPWANVESLARCVKELLEPVRPGARMEVRAPESAARASAVQNGEDG